MPMTYNRDWARGRDSSRGTTSTSEDCYARRSSSIEIPRSSPLSIRVSYPSETRVSVNIHSTVLRVDANTKASQDTGQEFRTTDRLEEYAEGRTGASG